MDNLISKMVLNENTGHQRQLNSIHCMDSLISFSESALGDYATIWEFGKDWDMVEDI